MNKVLTNLTKAFQKFKFTQVQTNSKKTKILVVGNNEMRSNIEIKIANTKLQQKIINLCTIVITIVQEKILIFWLFKYNSTF